MLTNIERMKKAKSREQEEGVSRLELPKLGLKHAQEDSDEESEEVSMIVNKFKQLQTMSGKSSLEDFMSLPTSMSQLSCRLESGIDENDLYLKSEGDLVVTNMKKKQVKDEDYSGAAPAEHKPHIGKKKLKKLKKLEREKNKGSDWFNMPALEMTEERKRDLELIKMRNVLDPKRHYKKNSSDTLPKYFQIGTILDNAADFYTDRVAKKDRKQTMVDELLADAEFKKYQKRKYVEIIEDKAKRHGRNFAKKRKSKT